MTNLTPSETETLKMFDEGLTPDGNVCTREYAKRVLLTQLRLARADERKQTYLEVVNCIREIKCETPDEYRMVEIILDHFITL